MSVVFHNKNKINLEFVYFIKIIQINIILIIVRNVNNKEMETSMKIAIIGTGYVGLVTGVCLQILEII